MSPATFSVRSLKGKIVGKVVRFGRLSIVHWSTGERMTFYGPAHVLFGPLTLQITRKGRIVTTLETEYAGLKQETVEFRSTPAKTFTDVDDAAIFMEGVTVC